MEHGGILISNLQFIMIQPNFDWIESMFEEGGDASEYKISPSDAEVYVPLAHAIPSYNYYFNEHIFAAIPHSKFITETFEKLQSICTTGRIAFN
jgi:hypothetical protein